MSSDPTTSGPAGPSTAARSPRATLAIGGFAHFVHDGFTDCVYVLLPLWASSFSLAHSEVGALKMVMSGTLAAAQVPAGMLAERWGERGVLAVGTAVAGLGFVLLGWAGGFAHLALCLLIAGAGCGTQHPLASAVISRAYPASGRRAALGTYNFTGDLGKVAAPAAVGLAAAVWGWEEGAVGYGAFGVAAAVAVFALLAPSAPTPGAETARGGAPDLDADARGATSAKSPAAAGWGIADRRGYAALAGIGMVDSGVRLGFLTFLPFLLLAKGAAVETLGLALALVFAGGAAGKLACGFVAERAGILRTVVLTEVATGAMMVALLWLPLTPALVLLLPFGIALNGTSSVLYGTVGDFVDGERQARAYGLFYTLGIGAGAVSPILFGVVSDGWGLTTALAAIAASLVLVLPLCWALRPSLVAVARRQES